MSLSQDSLAFTDKSLRRTNVAQSTASIVEVVTMNKPDGPLVGFVQIGKYRVRELRSALGSKDQAFEEGVVVTNQRPRE
jgi:hypothetical protein